MAPSRRIRLASLIVLFCIGAFAAGPRSSNTVSATLSQVWTTVGLPDTPLGIAVHDGAFWVCGANEMIARSSDGGRTWTLLHQRKHGEMLFALVFPTADAIQVYGTRGRRLVSTDGGAHWQEKWNKPRVTITSAQFATPDVGYALTPVGFGRTSDGGNHWKFWSDPNQPLYGAALAVHDSLRAAVLRGDDEVEVTSDGGRHWDRFELKNYSWSALRVSGPTFEVWGMRAPNHQRVTATLAGSRLRLHFALSLDESDCTQQGCLIAGGWLDTEGAAARAWSEPLDSSDPLTTAWAAAGAVFCRVSDTLRCRTGRTPWRPPESKQASVGNTSPLLSSVPVPDNLDRTQLHPGCVVLKVLIAPGGRVRSAVLVSAPSVGLAKTVEAAVRRFRFPTLKVATNGPGIETKVVVFFSNTQHLLI